MSAAMSADSAVAAKSRSPLASLGVSLLINMLGPYLVYRALEPTFPSPSLLPLAASALVPAVDLAVTYLRRRRVDAVAVIALSQLTASLLVGMAAHDPRASLVGQACQPALLGLVFALSAAIGRPLMIPLARQTMAGDDPQRQAKFLAMAAEPGPRRVFTRITLAWTAALFIQTGIDLLVLPHLSASAYVLFSQVFGYGLIAVLIVASIRYGRHAARRAQGI